MPESLSRTTTLRLAVVLLVAFGMPLLALTTAGLSTTSRSEGTTRGDTEDSPSATPRANIPPDQAPPVQVHVPETLDRVPETALADRPHSDVLAALLPIQQRLAALGANSMLLERVPGDHEQFYFRCVMPLPGTATYERPFDAEDRDPAQAMQRVEHDIRRWLLLEGQTRSVLHTAATPEKPQFSGW